MTAVAWAAIALMATTLLGTLFYLGAKIDGLGSRLDGRIDSLDERLTGRIDGLAGRIDGLAGMIADHLQRHTG